MIRGLWFILQLSVLVVAAVWLAEQRGPVSIEWGGWLVETSVGVLIFAMFVFAVFLLLLWRVWRGVAGTPHAISRLRFRRRRNQGYAALVRSLSAIAAQQGSDALSLATSAEEIGEPVLAHMAAAEAAEMAGNIPRAEEEYERLSGRADTAVIGLRGLTKLAEGRGDWAAALAFARRARKAAPKSPWAARRVFELECRLRSFAEAERALADAVKLGAFPPEESNRLLARLLLERGLEAEAAGRDAEALADAERAHGLDSALVGAAALGARLLAKSGRIQAAERMLAESWVVVHDPILSRAWMALSPAGDVTARLRQAERLVALDRDSVEGRLILAEVQLATGRWAEARGNLGNSQGLIGGSASSRRHSRLMALLESAAGNETAAQSWFEKSLAGLDEPPKTDAWVLPSPETA
jgi:HemY protein